MITININVHPEATRSPINKFYPYWIYVTNPNYENVKKQLEKVIKEVQNKDVVTNIKRPFS